jgi:hypothetical protein
MHKVLPLARRIHVRDAHTGEIFATAAGARCVAMPPECDPAADPVRVLVCAEGGAFLAYRSVRGDRIETWAPTAALAIVPYGELVLIEPDGWDHHVWWAGERVRAKSTSRGKRVRQ